MIHNKQRGFRQRRVHRGSTYLAVMGVTLVVSMIGMAVMVMARMELRRGLANQELAYAHCLAQNAVEFGLANLADDPAWRTTFTHDVESLPLDFDFAAGANGEMTFKLVDEKDSDLADDDSDAVRLYGIGRFGQADYRMSVLLEPIGEGLSCLEASLHSGGQIWMYNGVTINTDQFVSTNNQIWTNGSGIISGDAEAVSTIAAGSVTGNATTGVSSRRLPDTAAAFEYYLTNGTWIDFGDLPGGAIENVVLSPASNPYGSGRTDPQGIYVIDCQGFDLVVQDSRIVSTLVVLNPGPGTRLERAINWEPAVRNFPALMVAGNLMLKFNGVGTLNEGINFNPRVRPIRPNLTMIRTTSTLA